VFLSLPTHIYRHCCDTGNIQKKGCFQGLNCRDGRKLFFIIKKKHFVVGILTLNKSEVK